MIQSWVKRIKKANPKRLEKIRKEWSKKGRLYDMTEWPEVLAALNDRELELKGIKREPAF